MNRVRKKRLGFTLIELVVVIIILSILAVIAIPRFLDLSKDAQMAEVKNTAGSFASAISLARTVWISHGASGPLDDIPVYNHNKYGSLDFNKAGWPVQHFIGAHEQFPSLNYAADCVSLWQAMFANNSPSVSGKTNTDYLAQYIPTGQCKYHYNRQPNYYIYYNSNNGKVDYNIE
ncbi:pilus assembly FimT family protein [Shewanella marina]|uniref:pilus assembly FimT family protein n=1 Tax=Shewanella marina TaxID=487319 RepID=UPI000472B5EA|nr:prepilin-type N-terminal cleavage/methylation domain-containing protein [Shewanella marina]